MEPVVQDQLLRINQQFYEQFAGAFAGTRGLGQPGLRTLLPYLPVQGWLLDAGCGNGRLAHMLDEAGRPLEYVGLDGSAAMVEIARRRARSLSAVHAEFQRIDITSKGWSQGWQAGSFDAIALLAVLHHVPGQALRREVLATLRPLLAQTGVLAVSTWQFLVEERLRRKIVPWERVGLHPDQLEPRDYLIDWQREGQGLRYCHLVDQAELASLAAAAGLDLRHVFYADGASGALNLFGIATLSA